MQLLNALHCAQESIKSASAWFLTAPHMAGGLGAQMASHASGLPDYKARLHVLYLANDILLKACATAAQSWCGGVGWHEAAPLWSVEPGVA